jgi:hypothetical protein
MRDSMVNIGPVAVPCIRTPNIESPNLLLRFSVPFLSRGRLGRYGRGVITLSSCDFKKREDVIDSAGPLMDHIFGHRHVRWLGNPPANARRDLVEQKVVLRYRARKPVGGSLRKRSERRKFIKAHLHRSAFPEYREEFAGRRICFVGPIGKVESPGPFSEPCDKAGQAWGQAGGNEICLDLCAFSTQRFLTHRYSDRGDHSPYRSKCGRVVNPILHSTCRVSANCIAASCCDDYQPGNAYRLAQFSGHRNPFFISMILA